MDAKTTSTRPKWKRRALLAGGALVVIGWVKGAPHLLSLSGSDFEFEEISDLAPFRRLAGTRAVTTQGAVFAGLDTPSPVTPEIGRARKFVRSDPCLAIFGPAQTGQVPIAMFSDFACPICSVMNNRLADLQANAPDLFRIVRHELPLLGAASDLASQAVLAADMQGAYLEMHDRIARTPAVTDHAFIGRIADNIGLDRDQLLRDMESAQIKEKLRVSKAIADIFGFYGTPAFAIGRTVFLGALSTSFLEQLIAVEAEI